MPMPIWLAHKMAARLTEVRKEGIVDFLRPDGKTQVSIDYEDGVPEAAPHRAHLDPARRRHQHRRTSCGPR